MNIRLNDLRVPESLSAIPLGAVVQFSHDDQIQQGMRCQFEHAPGLQEGVLLLATGVFLPSKEITGPFVDISSLVAVHVIDPGLFNATEDETKKPGTLAVSRKEFYEWAIGKPDEAGAWVCIGSDNASAVGRSAKQLEAKMLVAERVRITATPVSEK